MSGIIPAQCLRTFAGAGVIFSEKYRIPDENVQPASLDLRLGEHAYRLRCSFLPDSEPVEAKLGDYEMERLDLRDGAILERNRPYLIPLIEELRLPADVRGRCNPKSSTGRVDVFTRVVTDRSYKFDEVAAGYHGKLYLEVVSRSFTVKVRSGLALNQLRLMSGGGALRYSDEEIAHRHAAEPLLFEDERSVAEGGLSLADGLLLSVDLSGGSRRVAGYRAKKNSRLLDLTRKAFYSAADFWEEIYPEEKGRVVLEPEEFYLLLSREGVRIPPDLAAEMIAYDPTSGELRTHYAGFFDPGFGYAPDDQRRGTRVALEVRAHDVPFMIEDGQRVCKLAFERMAGEPDILYGQEIGSSYSDQSTTLSKHFLPVAQGRLSLPWQPGLRLAV